MIPTPRQVVPVILPAVPELRDALRRGIDHADDLQPDPEDRDPWYWSHSARWRASRALRRITGEDGWTVISGVPNCGIHLRIGDLHVARVLRSLAGTTPHPGPNRRRREAWDGIQGQLALASDGELPPLSLILDWREVDGEPEMHVGLPAGSWKYRGVARLHWRVPLPEGGVDLNTLTFDPGPDTGEGLVALKVDPAEEEDLA